MQYRRMSCSELIAAADANEIAVFIADDGTAAIWGDKDAPSRLIEELESRSDRGEIAKP